jgi:hypothetical protein
MARTIIHEDLGIRPEVIEHQLAHRVPDALGTAYTRRQPKTHTAIITTTQLILNACTCLRRSRNGIH